MFPYSRAVSGLVGTIRTPDVSRSNRLKATTLSGVAHFRQQMMLTHNGFVSILFLQYLQNSIVSISACWMYLTIGFNEIVRNSIMIVSYRHTCRLVDYDLEFIFMYNFDWLVCHWWLVSMYFVFQSIAVFHDVIRSYFLAID